MKITVEISDPLVRQARKMATREGVMLRTLIERGLLCVVTEAKTDAPFKLRRVSFKGRGLRPELRAAPWTHIRSLSYERRDR